MTPAAVPPPPPPPENDAENTSQMQSREGDEKLKEALLLAGSTMEESRNIQAELEGCLLLASSLMNHPSGVGGTVDASSLPGALQDAWAAISRASQGAGSGSLLTESAVSSVSGRGTVTNANQATGENGGSGSNTKNKKKNAAEFSLGRGQVGKAIHTTALSACLKRAVDLSKKVDETKSPAVFESVQSFNAPPDAMMAVFDNRLQEIRQYHALHSPVEKRQKLGHPIADGYDLGSMIASELSQVETKFAVDEVMGKYLDLQGLSTEWKALPENMFDFLQVLSKGLDVGLAEKDKLKDRKKYSRFLVATQQCVQDFLERTCPLLDVQDIIAAAVKEFETTWRKTGGVLGWETKPAEASWVDGSNDSQSSNGNGGAVGIDLSSFGSADELLEAKGADSIKTELSRLGLKCGGKPLDRAKRLMLTKDTPLDQLPPKLFAKKKQPTATKTGTEGETGPGVSQSEASSGSAGERRVDLAKQEAITMALLNQVGPTLEGTMRRAERRQTQTPQEREKELEEDLYGSELIMKEEHDREKDSDDEDDDDEEEETQIYNPKGVPLGWDGKPIPYWLFKLHGLNHVYTCEICGGATYRGRHNFEKHFAEMKHTQGMRSLGIPNTKHFHGITKIQDAIDLWEKLQTTVKTGQFDGSAEEEYEDSHGNVLSRATYEDLARQGLL